MELTLFRRSSRLLLVLASLVVAPVHAGDAQTKRALIVGINEYAPPTLAVRLANAKKPADSVRGPVPDLEGAVNDASAMRGVLMARYGFDSTNMRMLTNAAATKAAILAAIDGMLADSRSGDVVVFYYAGHGSEQRNSKSREARGLDQTIVPSDANITGQDIRDKEIARSFNRFLDKGVQLTLIFDSCHSGSISRGPLDSHRARSAPYNPVDAADPESAPPPDSRGALVLSAAQDYELAHETVENGQDRGAFTVALIHVLMSQALTSPATRTFAETRAILQRDGLQQEPVLQGTAERQRRPLLSPDGAVANGHIIATVLHANGDTVELSGGPATGLLPGAEFHGMSETDVSTRLAVVASLAGTRSRAVRAGGKAAFKVGDSYELDVWPASATAGLNVWLPKEAASTAQLRDISTALVGLSGMSGIEWIADAATAAASTSPTMVVELVNGAWIMRSAFGDTTSLGLSPTAATIGQAATKMGDTIRLRGAALSRASNGTERVGPGVRVTAVLPPDAALLQAMRVAARDTMSVARFVGSAADANYLLVGRPGTAGVEYAWVRPGATRATEQISTLSARSRWIAGTTQNVATQLMEDALTLARVRSWLLLQSPPSAQPFPYHLAFRNHRTKALMTTGPFHGGDTIEIVLQRDPAAAVAGLRPRRVYVFAIDSHGQGSALFPAADGNNGNTIPPVKIDSSVDWTSEIAFPNSPMVIGAPFGMDTYFLLSVPATETIPIDLLNWNAARGVEAEQRGGESPLAALLRRAAGSTRDSGTVIPMEWTIERVPVLSVAPTASP